MCRKKYPKSTWKFILLALFLILLTAFILKASQPGREVEGCPEGCAVEIERRPGPLRILSLNMLHGFPNFEDLSLRLEIISSEIRRLDIDVVLLQEVPWTRSTGNAARDLAQELGFNYLYYRANGNRRLIFFEEGEAILSRFPLKNPRFSVMQPRIGFFESRVILMATADTPGGDVDFLVTHLTDKDPQANRGQVASLRSFVDKYIENVVVISGDFNATDDSLQVTGLARDWMDVFKNVYLSDPGLTCCIDNLSSGPEESLEKRIDYIFLVRKTGENGKIGSAEYVFDHPFSTGDGWQWASDHVGLMVVVEP